MRMSGLRPTIVLIATAVAVLLLPASALADHSYLESFGPDGTEATSFGESFGSRSVAVD
jgi:hypothetical protein